jgi:hypothetical protein
MVMAKTKDKSRKHRNKYKNRKLTRTRNALSDRSSASTSYEIDLDMTDKSLKDFQASKSITVATTKSDITSSKIGELYDVKPIHDNIQRLCQMKIEGKIAKEYPNGEVPKYISKQICKCLFEKNSGLRIVELEKLVKSRMDTPASSCISILDNSSKGKKKSSQRSQSRQSSRTSRAQ